MDLSFMEWSLPMYVTTAQPALTIAVIGIAISVVIGITASLALYYRILRLRQLVAVYVGLSHNTPLLMQLFFLYFGLPKTDIHLSPELCDIIGLSFPGGTYMTETFRAELEMVERIQSESTLSLGMSRAATMRYVVSPQAVAVSVSFLVVNTIFLIKEASVFSGVVLADLMYITKDLIGTYYQTTEALLMLIIAYLVLPLPISFFGS